MTTTPSPADTGERIEAEMAAVAAEAADLIRSTDWVPASALMAVLYERGLLEFNEGQERLWTLLVQLAGQPGIEVITTADDGPGFGYTTTK
ncbi:hypothetical protein JDV09_18900 [Mycobacterium sp. Y57]|uniref:hypothetical protein n=1 Tax=Mycolicibacterium xanthum TaxID=2796469 RepID=UPI001C85A024|nr:hypothetical protein [Mycolicibacterium xanthum]MBX7434168.1 hypothetical protein [Mycolicibacterium xanthum]